MASRTMTAVKGFEVRRAELDKQLKAGSILQAEELTKQIAELDRQIAGIMGVPIDQLGALRKAKK